MSTKQVASLLANNRKYLIHIANKGIKGDYTKVRDWFHLLRSNELRLLTLLNKSEESNIEMSLNTISVGLLSKDNQTATLSYQLLTEITESLDNSWNWFTNEGIEVLVFAICKHEELRINCINLMFDICKDNYNELGKIMAQRLSKEKIYEFFGTTFTFVQNCHQKIKVYVYGFLCEYCFAETGNEKCTAMSLIVELWIFTNEFYFKDSKINQAINFLKEGIRNKSPIVKKGAINQLFRLLDHFTNNKQATAPTTYKLLTFLFLENYNSPSLKEEFLSCFTKLFKTFPKMPIDIMLSPYLTQLKTSSNYNVVDFTFINTIIEHPKIKEEHLKDLLHISCNVCLTDVNYSRLSADLLSIVLEKIQLDFDTIEYLIHFLQNSLQLFLKFNDNVSRLESAYIIMQMEIPEIIQEMEQMVFEVNEKYFNMKKEFSMGLLSLLWFYDSHDDLLLLLNERNREVYPKLHNSVKDQEERYKKSPEYIIDKLLEKRFENENQKIFEMYSSKEKEKMLNKTLMKQLGMKDKDMSGKDLSFVDKSSNRGFIILNDGFLESNKKQEKYYVKPLQTIIDLLDEEPRERKAIESLKIKFKPQLNYFFKKYQNEKGASINKANYLKLLREIHIDIDSFTVENLSMLIRSMYGVPLTIFDYEKYLDLSIQVSFFIFSNSHPSDSISQNFERLCKMLIFPKKPDSIELISLRESLKENPDHLIPPGFKKINVPHINYNYVIPECVKNVIGRSKTMVYELIDEIINKALNTHIIEPIVEITETIDLEENVLKRNKWRMSILNEVSNVDVNNRQYYIEAADVMEKLLQDVEYKYNHRGRRLSPRTKEYLKMEEQFKVVEEKRKEKRKLREQFIKKKISDYKEELRVQNEKEQAEKINRKLKEEEALRKQLSKEREEHQKTKKIVEENKKKKEEENQEKENEKKLKIEKRQKEQEKEKEVFFTHQKRKLKEQFKLITNHQKELKELELKERTKVKEIDIQKIFLKEKEQIVFEKNMNIIAESILTRKDIADLFFKYDTNLKIVYDIYSQNKYESKIRYNEIYAISYENFKFFLMDFSVLGLLITNEQMNYIFRKVARKHNDNIDEDFFYLDFNDFLITILYLSIYSKYTNRSRRIMQEDFQKADRSTIQSFFDFLGFVIPCVKNDLENFIHDRRALNSKQQIVLKKIYKQEIIPKIIRPEHKNNRFIKFKPNEEFEEFNKLREEKFKEALNWERKLKEREKAIKDSKKSPQARERERMLQEKMKQELNNSQIKENTQKETKDNKVTKAATPATPIKGKQSVKDPPSLTPSASEKDKKSPQSKKEEEKKEEKKDAPYVDKKAKPAKK